LVFAAQPINDLANSVVDELEDIVVHRLEAGIEVVRRSMCIDLELAAQRR
jgi:hypothetical protein